MTKQYNARGQMLPGAAFLLMLSALLMFAVFSHGHQSNQKTVLVNAADAAAYSGAVWTARNLNFMAYTNRAIFANHVAMGHFVGYMSWLRFYSKLGNNASKVLQFIPGLGGYIASINAIIQKGQAVVENTLAPAYINTLSQFNQGLFYTQSASRLMGVVTLKSVIEETAQAHHPSIRINHPDDLVDVAKELSHLSSLFAYIQLSYTDLASLGRTMRMYWDYYAFTSSFTPNRDVKDGYRYRTVSMTDKTLYGMQAGRVVESTGMPQQKWFSGRNWDFSIFGKHLLKKRGSTSQVIGENHRDWFASDKLHLRYWSFKPKPGWKWKETLSAQATASEFAIGHKYKGMPGYQELSRSERKYRHSPSNKTSLEYAVLVSMPSQSLGLSGKGSHPKQGRLYAVSRSKVFYQRPVSYMGSKKGFNSLGSKEYPNLFSPFWQASLI